MKVAGSPPETLSIPEVRSERHLQVFAKLYQENPLLGDPKKDGEWALSPSYIEPTTATFSRDGQGWPLMEGKCFHQFLPEYEKPAFTVDPDQGLKRTARCKYYKDGLNGFLHMMPRVAFRDVARSTDVRSAIACILPPQTLCSKKAPLVIPLLEGHVPKDKGSRVHWLFSWCLQLICV